MTGRTEQERERAAAAMVEDLRMQLGARDAEIVSLRAEIRRLAVLVQPVSDDAELETDQDEEGET